ncbi:hypothetical protein ABW20_dc0104434 [Dactylellina cionopaga]|nr:hypothetical protein ABW20_dc0104434 [Dactylellina cionopaga]
MPSQPTSKGSSWNGEGSSSSASNYNTNGNSNPKVDALLAAAPRLSLDETHLDPPSYDDANSIRSGIVNNGKSQAQEVGIGIQDAIEFEYAFEVANTHEELATSVVRHPSSKSTILVLQRLAIGPRRATTQTPTTFELNALPLAANQLEITAKSNKEMGIRSLKVGMLDIAEDDPDIQFGTIDWTEKTTGTTAWASNMPDVFFDRPYGLPPDIIFFLRTFSFKANIPRRIKATQLGTGQQGFHPKFVFGPVGPSSVLDAKATWLAIPKDSRRFDCGTFEVAAKPTTLTTLFTGTVNFTKWKFSKKNTPKVIVGMTGIDQDYNRPFRFSVAVTGESHEGFSWSVRNWDDQVNSAWGATISWIAIANPEGNL